MIFFNLGLGILFISLGFIVTEANAGTLLSGYNTMSKDDQAKFPLKEYLGKFRQFHLYFGISFITIGTLIGLFWDKDVLGYHIGITPIIAYLFFFIKTKDIDKSSSSSTKVQAKIGAGVLLATLIFVIILFVWSERESRMHMYKDEVSISGPYGLTIPFNEMDSIVLLEKIPKIRLRLNGISTSSVSKGKFKGAGQSRYHLLLDKPYKQAVIIYRSKDIPVIISLDQVVEEELYISLKEKLAAL
jgi:hypothetical protein